MSERNAQLARHIIDTLKLHATVGYDRENDCYYVDFYSVNRLYYKFWRFRRAARAIRSI